MEIKPRADLLCILCAVVKGFCFSWRWRGAGWAWGAGGGGGGATREREKKKKREETLGVGVEGGSNSFLYSPMALTVQLSVSGMTSEGSSRSSCTSCFCSSAKTLSKDRDVRHVHDTL